MAECWKSYKMRSTWKHLILTRLEGIKEVMTNSRIVRLNSMKGDELRDKQQMVK